jgi:hypothetical protein
MVQDTKNTCKLALKLLHVSNFLHCKFWQECIIFSTTRCYTHTHTKRFVRSEILTVVLLKIKFSRVVTLCCWVDSCQHFEQLKCFHLQGQTVQEYLHRKLGTAGVGEKGGEKLGVRWTTGMCSDMHLALVCWMRCYDIKITENYTSHNIDHL